MYVFSEYVRNSYQKTWVPYKDFSNYCTLKKQTWSDSIGTTRHLDIDRSHDRLTDHMTGHMTD